MENQVTNNENALRLFFTEDVFLIEDNTVYIAPEGILKPDFKVESTSVTALKASAKIGESPSISENIPSTEVKDYPKPADLAQIVEEPTAPIVFKYLGGNQKSVLILVHDTINDVSTERGRDLLRKIVKAIELSTPDFALVNYANHLGADFTTLHQFFKPQVMLSFGVNADSLKLNVIWQNEIIQHQSTKLIFAPNLDDLEVDQSAKKLLWAHLQKLK